jgi:tetratricopeptide (TPR) repeat protein
MFHFVIRHLLFVILLLLLSWGCHKKSAAPVPAPSRTNVPPPAVTPPALSPSHPATLEPAPLPKTISAPSSFDLGEMSFQLGNYSQAAGLYEDFLQANPKSANRDTALFHLGLSLALGNDSSRDLQQAEAAFRRLISEFPKSPYRGQAEFIVRLQAQIEKLRSDMKERDDKIKQLSEELQKLKEIDMQRKPSRAPE